MAIRARNSALDPGGSPLQTARVVKEREAPPEMIADFARQAEVSVERSVGVALDYGSDTLPLLDHYLRNAADGDPQTLVLVASMSGAYFGEVIRKRLGGAWQIDHEDPGLWRLTLPGGLSFAPVRLAMGAMLGEDDADGDPDFRAPDKVLPHLEAALGRMAPMTTTEYYSLSCRFDALEHLQDVLLAIAAELARQQEVGDSDPTLS